MQTEEERISVSGGDMHRAYDRGLHSFAEEAHNLQRFRQTDGVVSVFDFCYENNTAYIVMEYAEGETLKQKLEKNGGVMPYQLVMQMMHPILEVLAKIHKEGIVHRDISPDNIVADENGICTLIDFGAARIATGNETKSMTIMLKHGYAPVEQYLSRGRQGPWTDIYAICATMYHLMTGLIPQEATERVLDDKLVPLKTIRPEIPVVIDKAISKGMEVKSERRYQKVEELIGTLYDIVPEIYTAGEKESAQEISEIDAFGPWIYEISRKYPIPPLFRPYVTEEMKRAHMLIKVPRNIDRKQAKKEKNLYNYVMGVCQKELRILERIDDQVQEHSILYSDILGIQITHDLLLGEVLLFTAVKTFQITYNTTSSDVMNRFIKLVREKSFSTAFPGLAEKMKTEKWKEEFLPNVFRKKLLKLRGNGQVFVPIHYMPQVQLQKYCIPGYLYTISDKELLILQKGDINQKINYSTHLLFLPVSKLGAMKIRPDYRYSDMNRYTIQAGTKTVLLQVSRTDRKIEEVYQKLVREVERRRELLNGFLFKEGVENDRSK